MTLIQRTDIRAHRKDIWNLNSWRTIQWRELNTIWKLKIVGKYYVAVRAVSGKIGLGVPGGKNEGKTFKLAIANARKGMICIRKSFYREDNSGNKHTLPRPVRAKNGKLRASAYPAPCGTGIAHPMARGFFNLAGIEHCILKNSS